MLHQRTHRVAARIGAAKHVEVKLASGPVRCRILDGHVTNFRSEPMVSLGASGSSTREVIFFDPSSAFLRKKYAELKEQITRKTDPHNIINIAATSVIKERLMFGSCTKKKMGDYILSTACGG